MLLTPEQIASSGTEEGHQKALMQWAATLSKLKNIDLLFAVPNGGDRRPSVAAALKASGVKRGVPDLCWPVPVGPYHGLYLELKKLGEQTKKNGGRSDDQVKWAGRLVELGYAVATVYGWQAARAVLDSYVDERLTMPEGGDALEVCYGGEVESC